LNQPALVTKEKEKKKKKKKKKKKTFFFLTVCKINHHSTPINTSTHIHFAMASSSTGEANGGNLAPRKQSSTRGGRTEYEIHAQRVCLNIDFSFYCFGLCCF
jgi:hypothetical protein